MPKEADTEHAPAENEGTNTVDDNVRETDQGGIITSDAQEDITVETDDTQGDRTQTKETDKYRKEIDVYWCVSKKTTLCMVQLVQKMHLHSTSFQLETQNIPLSSSLCIGKGIDRD